VPEHDPVTAQQRHGDVFQRFRIDARSAAWLCAGARRASCLGAHAPHQCPASRFFHRRAAPRRRFLSLLARLLAGCSIARMPAKLSALTSPVDSRSPS
jgi:hypothetical protein